MRYRVKLHNRRIFGKGEEDGSTSYRFKNLIDGEICKAEIRLDDDWKDIKPIIETLSKLGNTYVTMDE